MEPTTDIQLGEPNLPFCSERELVFDLSKQPSDDWVTVFEEVATKAVQAGTRIEVAYADGRLTVTLHRAEQYHAAYPLHTIVNRSKRDEIAAWVEQANDLLKERLLVQEAARSQEAARQATLAAQLQKWAADLKS